MRVEDGEHLDLHLNIYIYNKEKSSIFFFYLHIFIFFGLDRCILFVKSMYLKIGYVSLEVGYVDLVFLTCGFVRYVLHRRAAQMI